MTTREVIKSLRMIKSTCFIGNRKFLDALEQAVEMLEAQEWVPCSERLPEEPIRVMANLDNGWIITAYRQEEEWLTVPDCGEPISDDEVIAWMPLPEPFKEGEG